MNTKASLGILAAFAGIIWYLGKKPAPAEGAGVIRGVVPAVDEAVAAATDMINSPVGTSQVLQSYIDVYPGAVDMLSQVEANLMSGMASVEDMIGLKAGLTAYDMYAKDGGALPINEFLVWQQSSMDPKYRAVIDEAKLTADIATIQALNYGAGSDREREYIENYGNWGIKAAYAVLHPDYVPTMTAAEAADFQGDLPAGITILGESEADRIAREEPWKLYGYATRDEWIGVNEVDTILLQEPTPAPEPIVLADPIVDAVSAPVPAPDPVPIPMPILVPDMSGSEQKDPLLYMPWDIIIATVDPPPTLAPEPIDLWWEVPDPPQDPEPAPAEPSYYVPDDYFYDMF